MPADYKKKLRDRINEVNTSLDNIQIQKTEFIDKNELKSGNLKGY